MSCDWVVTWTPTPPVPTPRCSTAVSPTSSGPCGTETGTSSVRTDDLDYDLPEQLIAQTPIEPRDAARLLVDLYAQDWRDVLPRITLPTLVVAGEASLFNPQSQRWNATQIPGARLEMFSAEDGGSHFMWLENPNRFNALIRDFVQD